MVGLLLTWTRSPFTIPNEFNSAVEFRETRDGGTATGPHTILSLSLSLSLVSSRSSQRRGVALDVAGMRRFLGDAATKLRRRIATSSRASRTRGNRTRFVDFVGSGYLRSTSPALGGLICFLLLLFSNPLFFFVRFILWRLVLPKIDDCRWAKKRSREKKKKIPEPPIRYFFFCPAVFFFLKVLGR